MRNAKSQPPSSFTLLLPVPAFGAGKCRPFRQISVSNLEPWIACRQLHATGLSTMSTGEADCIHHPLSLAPYLAPGHKYQRPEEDTHTIQTGLLPGERSPCHHQWIGRTLSGGWSFGWPVRSSSASGEGRKRSPDWNVATLWNGSLHVSRRQTLNVTRRRRTPITVGGWIRKWIIKTKRSVEGGKCQDNYYDDYPGWIWQQDDIQIHDKKRNNCH